MRLTAPLSEVRAISRTSPVTESALREAVKEFALANDTKIFEGGKVMLPNKLPMPLNPDEDKETVKARAARDPAFAKAMLDEAATAFLNGEPHVARLILRDLVNASVGFEELASETNRPSKSLHRMLSEKGNPSMDNLAAIFGAVRKRLGVAFEAHAVEAA